MAFRFQRRINIAPWLRMNISQSGLPDMGLIAMGRFLLDCASCHGLIWTDSARS